MSTLRINKITIENFRGIKSPVIIDFVKGGQNTSALIYGRNGTGKSSIIDSWEWLINSKIEYLKKEGISERDYPHKLSNGDNVYVKVDFMHPVISSVKASFDKTKITSPVITGEFALFKNHTIYPNYLKYSDLQDFVLKTKGDKYKYIAKFFGLEDFLKKQADINASLTRTTETLNTLTSLLNENKVSIKKIIGQQEVTEENILIFLNNLARKHGISEITEFKDADTILTSLSDIVKKNPVAIELAEWKSFQLRLNKFYPLSKIAGSSIEVEDIFNELKKDEENITKLILIKLYDSANTVLSGLENKNICPVCDKDFGSSLIDHISKKHLPLKNLNDKKNTYIDKRDILIKKLEEISTKVSVIQSECGINVLRDFSSFFDDIKILQTQIPKTVLQLKKLFKDLSSLNLSTQEDVLKTDLLHDNVIKNKQTVAKKITTLSIDENTKNLATDYGNTFQLIDIFTKYLKNNKKVEYLITVNTGLDNFFKSLTNHIQTQIQNTFTSIQTDVIECYNYLEGANQFLKNPKIKLVTGRDKAIELEIEFVNEKITPAYKFMSESQINSFGLAIFLSAVKHFNSNFKFIILDDIVNSFDAAKRPKVAQLLAEKFDDFQILMMTHDQIFFDTMQKHFPQWNRYKFASWDYTTGPRCIFSNNYTEEIQRLIDDDDSIGAGQKLGRYLEMTMGYINENLQTPLKYKLENVYTLAEFYDPLVKRFKKKLKVPNKKHKISTLFEEFEQGAIFRNYCAHWKDETTQFTATEIDNIFKKWLEIEAEIYCPDCKTYCNYNKEHGVEYIKCACGSLNMKEDGKFIDSN